MMEQKIELFIGPPSITTDIEIKIPNQDCEFYINCYNAQKIKDYLDKYLIFSEKKFIRNLIKKIISMPDIENNPTYMIIINKHLDNYKDELLDLIHLIHSKDPTNFVKSMLDLETFLKNLNFKVQNSAERDRDKLIEFSSDELYPEYKKEICNKLIDIINLLHIKMFLMDLMSMSEDDRIAYIKQYKDSIYEYIEILDTDINTDIREYFSKNILIEKYNIQIMKIVKVTPEIYKIIKGTLPKIFKEIDKMDEYGKNNAYLIYTDYITKIDPKFKFFNILSDAYDAEKEIEFSKLCIIADLKERQLNKDNSGNIEKGFRIIPKITYNSECMKENINESSKKESSIKESSKKESLKSSISTRKESLTQFEQ